MSVVYRRRVVKSVVASGDDAYQTGVTVNTSATAMYLSANGDIIGLRFTNITIPVGATVTLARVRGHFQTGTANLRIHCEAADNAVGFTTASNNIGARPKTTAYTAWNAAVTGGQQDTPDITAAVQEVADRGGWASGNALVVLLQNQAAAGLTLLSYDGGAVIPRLTIEYTIPSPGGEPAIDSVVSSSLRGSNNYSFSVPIPAGSGTRVYIAVHAMRAVWGGTYPDWIFNLSSASLGDADLSPVLSDEYRANSTSVRHMIFEAIDPLGGGAAASQTFRITFDKSVTLGINAVVVTGVTERGDPAAYNTYTGGTGSFSSTNLSVNITTDQVPGLILTTGNLRRKGADHTDLYAANDSWVVARNQTGTTHNNDLLYFVAAAEADTAGAYTMGMAWETPTDAGAIAAIPLYGRVAAAEIELTAIAPEVIYANATLDDLTAEAEFIGGGAPRIVTGSIPPVQVAGLGNLYLSTSARILTVMALATAGDSWVLVDGSGVPVQLGLRIVRRAGYLTPV